MWPAKSHERLVRGGIRLFPVLWSAPDVGPRFSVQVQGQRQPAGDARSRCAAISRSASPRSWPNGQRRSCTSESKPRAPTRRCGCCTMARRTRTATSTTATSSTRSSRTSSSSRARWPGFRTPYVPGWDTHGLPIELAVERELGPKRKAMSVAEIRRACRDYALKFVAIQRTEFERLGVLGAWREPYLTLDNSYEGAIASALATFTRGGWLYRGKKPVIWCPRDQTALAEAEIEYKDKSSPSVYVRFPLEAGWRRQARVARDLDDHAVDAAREPRDRRASRLHVRRDPASSPGSGPSQLRQDEVEYLIVAKELAESVGEAIGGLDLSSAIEITPTEMKKLEGARYRHPFVTEPQNAECWKLWFADYVTADTGTGLVHTAPGHGADDYRTGVAHGLPAYAPLDDAGRYTSGTPLRARRQDHRRGEPDHHGVAPRARLLAQPADRSRSDTPMRTAGAARTRSSIARHRSGSSRWITRSFARKRLPRSTRRRGSRRGATIASTR